MHRDLRPAEACLPWGGADVDFADANAFGACMTTMLFERVGDVLVLVHGVEDPSDAEWNPYVSFAEAHQRSTKPLIGLLVTTLGGSPNAGQRRAIAAVSKIRPIPTCVCGNSMVARGVVTAIRWLTDAPIYGLRLDQIDDALELMKVPADDHAAVKVILARLQRQVSSLPAA